MRSFSWNGEIIGISEAVVLAQALNHRPTPKQLDLSDNSISDSGAKVPRSGSTSQLPCRS